MYITPYVPLVMVFPSSKPILAYLMFIRKCIIPTRPIQMRVRIATHLNTLALLLTTFHSVIINDMI